MGGTGYGPRVLGQEAYQQEQKARRTGPYGPRVTGGKGGSPDPEPGNSGSPARAMDVAAPDDPDAELRREILAFVREHRGCPESAVRRSIRGSTKRVRRAVRELLKAGELEDRGDTRSKQLHVSGPGDEGGES